MPTDGDNRNKAVLGCRAMDRKMFSGVHIVGGHRYILKDVTDNNGGSMNLSRAVAVSLIHKLTRSAMQPELAYLVKAFFVAISRCSDKTKLRGGITNFLNRFAIALSEEGATLSIDEEGLVQIVFHLLAGRVHAELTENWDAVTDHFVEILALTSGIPLCRAGSLVKALGYALQDKKMSALLQELHPDISSRLSDGFQSKTQIQLEVLEAVSHAKTQVVFGTRSKKSVDYDIAFTDAQRLCRPLAVLADRRGKIGVGDYQRYFDKCKLLNHDGKLRADDLRAAAMRYAESDELRKNLYSVCHCRRLVSEFVTTNPSQTCIPRAFDLQTVDRIGANDMHVHGIENEQARATFRNVGCKVRNMARTFTVFGLSHEDMETVYQEVSKVLHAQKAEQKAAERLAKMKAKAASSPKGQKRKFSGHVLFEGDPPLDAPMYEDITSLVDVDITQGDRICGFKNFTLTSTLTTIAQAGLGLGPRVFLKLGESTADNEFSLKASDAMSRLGMPFVRSKLVGLKLDVAWWRSFGAECHKIDPNGLEINKRSYQKWTNSMVFKYAGNKLKDGQTYCAIVQDCFPGSRLTYVEKADPRLLSVAFAKTMAQSLLFSKWCGITDMGPYNLMIDKDGRVLQIDLGISTDEQVSSYNSKKLLTSHQNQFVPRFLGPVKQYFLQNRAEIYDFIQALSECGLPMRKNVIFPVRPEERREDFLQQDEVSYMKRFFEM